MTLVQRRAKPGDAVEVGQVERHQCRTAAVVADLVVELLEPATPGSPIDTFIERRGPGIHHVCFATPDLDAALARCRAAGVRLIDDVPRIGAEGKRIAFVHPSATGGVLVELTEMESAG